MNVPNHERKAFRDMTPEERSSIVEAWVSGNIEEMGALSWHGGSPLAIATQGIYRTRPRQLVIPWEHIKPEYKWAAMDNDGRVFLYKHKPEIKGLERGWRCGAGASLFSADVFNHDTTGIDWRESLTARPEVV